MSMFSPPRREKARPDDSHLPKGDCRYILLHPEVKGLRCACVGFALNRSIPGSTCDCGHQACYHSPDKENASVERQELEALREKVNMLEEELDRERQGGRGGIVDRLGRLEELVDRTKADTESELKGVYRNIGGLWQSVGGLNKRTSDYDDHLESLADGVERMRHRLIEIDDASMHVEDRVDALENSATPLSAIISRRRKASTPPSPALDDGSDCSVRSEETATTSRSELRYALQLVRPEEAEVLTIQSFRERVASVGSGAQAWTVHISMLPTSSQPFPFEKDTAAYKRCLSRGLHQVIVVPDTDSHSFKTSVDQAFLEILRGRPWDPLVARICDAKNLRGLPMLRQLPRNLVGSDYNAEFLQHNCAVVDESGKILDLYIAMSEDTISWAELKEVTPFKPGLEASWTYDPYLDGTGRDGPETSRPAAGDILTGWSPSLKRNASEISRSPSFGSTDGEGPRAKIRRHPAPCPGASVEVVGRRAEAV
ncbi:hypothetical protein L207DRAFT_134006 [Hyaloscypha variabilis F]|uniref:Uncharacterized protein n=1 Tax=Hyaloscypha variabilis (strain UAMH 11265 / GT02V1 / F) TaxID=1149755 RepID=A0A2J6R6A3_HYAVF|nr:hypothetical protein L207DRAFT_134006 [Hyaloscypha variabilis F]